MTEATKTVNKAAEVMAQTVQIGTVVDSVSEVLNVGGSDIENHLRSEQSLIRNMSLEWPRSEEG